MKNRWFALGAVALFTLASCGGQTPPPEAPAPTPPEPAAAPEPPPAPVEKLKLHVVTASPEGFMVNSVLVAGEKDAVLIDSQFTLPDAKRVVEAVQAAGKNLTTVYISHWHPDHYFGLVALKEAFPNAKLVALPVTVEQIKKTWADKVKQWKPLYKDGITDKPVVPEALSGTTLELETEKLEITGPVQGDSEDNSYVWIPALKAVVAGDIVYDDVFPWTAETTAETRKAWIATLDKLTALNAAVVVPGHQKPEKKQEPASIQFTKEYLVAYDEALASSKNAAELQAKLKEKYPNAALDIVLKIGAEASFKKPAKKK